MITVVKVGGALIENKNLLDEFLYQFAKIQGQKILVHGGGRSSSEWMRKLGLTPQLIDGRRVTDAQTLEIVTLAYSGINKQLVAQLQHINVNAIGLCGADGHLLKAKKRPPTPINFGFVGDVDKDQVNKEFLQLLLSNQITPIIAPLTYDKEGSLLNTNADTMASVIAQACQQIAPTRLIYVFEKPGLLRDAEDDRSLLTSFSEEDYVAAKTEGFIYAGMHPKLKNAFDAKRAGVDQVFICNTDNLATLNIGTEIL